MEAEYNMFGICTKHTFKDGEDYIVVGTENGMNVHNRDIHFISSNKNMDNVTVAFLIENTISE